MTNSINDNYMNFQNTTIQYNGCDYPTITLDVPGFCPEALISVASLNNEIMDEDGNYHTEEGRAIDEKIFFYVEDDEITLPENEVVQIILSHLS